MQCLELLSHGLLQALEVLLGLFAPVHGQGQLGQLGGLLSLLSLQLVIVRLQLLLGQA